eukprot:13022653-Ditylum_brightwellii.AAC.1
MDAYWDTCYYRLPPGSEHCSHIFIAEKSESTVLKMQDCNESVVCSKDLMKGSTINQIKELKKMEENLVALEPPGLRHIKQIEIDIKFWPFVDD